MRVGDDVHREVGIDEFALILAEFTSQLGVGEQAQDRRGELLCVARFDKHQVAPAAQL